MIKKAKYLVVFLIILFYFVYFDIRFLDSRIVNISTFVFWALSICLSIPFIFGKTEGFIMPIRIMVISVVISIFMAQIGWGQNLKDTVIATVPFLVWIFFFFLLENKIPIKTVENIIIFYGLLYIALYFFQLAHHSTIYFGKSMNGWEATSYAEDRGIARIIFPGGGVFYLLVFMAINKLTIGDSKKWLWRILAVAGIVIPLLQVTRQFILGVGIIYFIHFTRNMANYKRILVVAASIVLFFYVTNVDNSLIKGISTETKNNINQGDDYVRVQAAQYFLSDFSPLKVNKIFGNGVEAAKSYYGLFIEQIRIKYRYFRSDVGLVGLYAMFGVLSIIAYLIIWIKSFTVPLPEEYQYLKYYLWLLLFTSLTWYSVYDHGYLIITVFVLYMYHSISQEIPEILEPGEELSES